MLAFRDNNHRSVSNRFVLGTNHHKKPHQYTKLIYVGWSIGCGGVANKLSLKEPILYLDLFLLKVLFVWIGSHEIDHHETNHQYTGRICSFFFHMHLSSASPRYTLRIDGYFGQTKCCKNLRQIPHLLGVKYLRMTQKYHRQIVTNLTPHSDLDFFKR